jgi:group II intron reverse transcriptase/maturase
VEAKESFKEWIEPMLQSMHRKGYRAPVIRRVYIPKPGRQQMRPLGVPCVSDRALQRSVAQVLSAVYEQDFLPCSFGGRSGVGAHNALATLNEVIAGRKISWVLEADLKNFFGSLDHKWMMRFVEHRIGDPRLISLIRRWLKAGVLEDGEIHPSEEGTPQGGSISVLLSNLYLHYVLDLWFERLVMAVRNLSFCSAVKLTKKVSTSNANVRDIGKCGADSNLDCNICVCSGSHSKETAKIRSKSLHNFTDFQYYSF